MTLLLTTLNGHKGFPALVKGNRSEIIGVVEEISIPNFHQCTTGAFVLVKLCTRGNNGDLMYFISHPATILNRCCPPVVNKENNSCIHTVIQ